MGLFSKKRTTVTKEVKNFTATKVVKFSYLQSLLVNGRQASLEDFAGVSDPRNFTFRLGQNTSRNRQSAFANNLANQLGEVGNLTAGALSYGLLPLANSLFGRRTTITKKVEIKEGGWTLVKSWAQPQFDIIRYAIGIKDLGVSQFNYDTVSEMVSKPWASPKEIVKVSMTVNQVIPAEFGDGTFIEYYIKPNIEESSWLRINPMELPTQYFDNGNIVPRIISFNSEKPLTATNEESYLLTSDPVTSIRVRVLMKRPSDSDPSLTPILTSYRVLMVPKGGL